mmetsp:Transcript_25872/g.43657  ORF Transcript_25872/g.43657 Transcript_25872/m.43657 type:complete len:282 (-) Transcript_25872:397-1242(-)
MAGCVVVVGLVHARSGEVQHRQNRPPERQPRVKGPVKQVRSRCCVLVRVPRRVVDDHQSKLNEDADAASGHHHDQAVQGGLKAETQAGGGRGGGELARPGVCPGPRLAQHARHALQAARQPQPRVQHEQRESKGDGDLQQDGDAVGHGARVLVHVAHGNDQHEVEEAEQREDSVEEHQKAGAEHERQAAYLLNRVEHRTPVVDDDAVGCQQEHGLELVEGVGDVVVVLNHDEGHIHGQVHRHGQHQQHVQQHLLLRSELVERSQPSLCVQVNEGPVDRDKT